MEQGEHADANGGEWHYELNGARLGPISDAGMRALISEQKLSRNSYVWKKGLGDWTTVSNTAFSTEFDDSPPPLSGAVVDNTLVWWLAVAPVAGTLLASFLAGATNKEISSFWWVTLVLNIVLSTLDAKKLQKAGHDTSRMGAAWFIPVYLYKRAEVLKQKNTYFVVWVVLFCLSLLSDV
jgi:hypothetical protein